MNGAKIMIVEDEQIVALDIKMHLQKHGYEVPGMFASGEDAVREVAALKPDLILMDIKLQGKMDGLEAASRITEAHGIPVILLTANADESTIQRAKFTQPYAYIIKPFEERELRTAIVLALYRHEMELKLVQRERLFSTTLRSIGEAVFVTDVDDSVNFMNPIAEYLVGKPFSEAVGAKLSTILHLVDEKDDEVNTDYLIREDGEISVQDVFQFVGNLVRDDGVHVPVELRKSALIDDAGNRTGWVWVLNDITARVKSEQALRESEEQLRHAQKMEAVGRLSGGIAHDFNNLLTIIMGYSKLLKESLQNNDGAPGELLGDVDGILKAATKSAELTRQLLAFSRHQVMQPVVISLNRILSEVERMIRRLLTENITIQISLTNEPCRIYADQGQIEQVLLNLAVNAKDAMPNGGNITIRSGIEQVDSRRKTVTGVIEPGPYAVLRVQDTGTGIEPEILPRIFDPFFTTKGVGRGTGLGLSTVYGIIAQSGGKIDVVSILGKGTLFLIYLPLVEMGEEGTERVPHQESRLSGSESVLVVEDERTVRELLVRVMQGAGYAVTTTENAGEALLISEEENNHFDILISDVVMPHITGPKLSIRLRAKHADLKVLFISGHPENEEVEIELKDSMCAFLQKPFEPEVLLRKVRELLDVPVR
ncbi:MAG TPA: response regulator [Spirochaetia bacterium]|nr:response regulator [Spirochaetia bacterium]